MSIYFLIAIPIFLFIRFIYKVITADKKQLEEITEKIGDIDIDV